MAKKRNVPRNRFLRGEIRSRTCEEESILQREEGRKRIMQEQGSKELETRRTKIEKTDRNSR